MWNSKKVYFLVLGCVFFVTQLHGQDIFGVEATKNYADFLKNKREYEKAAAEYERLLFLDSAQIDYCNSQLVICYYHLGDLNSIYNIGIQEFDPDESKYVFKTFLKNKRYGDALNLLDSTNYSFNKEQINFNKGLTYLLKGDFSSAQSFLEQDYSDDLIMDHKPFIKDVNTDLFNYRGKSPFLAASLSAIIPSSGRLYTKDYADAALNFIFISVTAIQAYRGFTNPEIGRWQGWLYGGLSASFYVGNVFGSWKAAKRYNKRYYDEKLAKASRYIFGNY